MIGRKAFFVKKTHLSIFCRSLWKKTCPHKNSRGKVEFCLLYSACHCNNCNIILLPPLSKKQIRHIKIINRQPYIFETELHQSSCCNRMHAYVFAIYRIYLHSGWIHVSCKTTWLSFRFWIAHPCSNILGNNAYTHTRRNMHAYLPLKSGQFRLVNGWLHAAGYYCTTT